MSLFDTNKNKRFLPRDYHQKNLENPFFKRKHHIIPLTKLKAKLIIVAVLLFLAAAFWFLFFSSFGQIKSVSVAGLDQMTDEEIRGLIAQQLNAKNFFVLPQKNLLFFQEKKFRETLKGRYRFQKIVIQKKWPNELSVIITEKPIACAWIENSKYYYIDTDGYVVAEINPLDLTDKKYPLVSNESGFMIRDSKIGLDPAAVNSAAKIYEKINNGPLGITVDRLIFDNEVDTIKVQTKEGLKISFDTAGDFDAQLSRLATLKNQKLKNDFFNKKKIDLRFGDKIYYQ